MTVAELIEKLQGFDPNMVVWIEDNEYGPGEASMISTGQDRDGTSYVLMY